MSYKKKMPPELLAHFKKKQEAQEPAGEEKSDNERRKEAVNKARIRLEEKNGRRADDKEKETDQARSGAS